MVKKSKSKKSKKVAKPLKVVVKKPKVKKLVKPKVKAAKSKKLFSKKHELPKLEAPVFDKAITKGDKVFAIFAYLSLFGLLIIAMIPFFQLPLFLVGLGLFLYLPWWLIPLFARRDKPWVQKHAKQGTIIYLIFLLPIWIPVVGWVIAAIYWIFSVISFIKILRGDRFWGMPLLNKLVR